MGLIIWIIVGGVAGFLAGKVVRGKGMGLLWDVVVGILGAFVGAVILLAIFRALTHRGILHR